MQAREDRRLFEDNPTCSSESLKDGFDLEGIKASEIPMDAGLVLVKDEDDSMSESNKKLYRRGVGKLLHLMRFSRPELVKSTRELSKFMTSSTSPAHLKKMKEVIKHEVKTSEKKWFMKPNVR